MSILVHKEHPESRAVQLQFPVLQPLLWYNHFSDQVLISYPAHCPAFPAHGGCTCHFWKLHVAGELIIDAYSEEACTAFVCAGEVEINVHEVCPHIWWRQWLLNPVKQEVFSYRTSFTLVKFSPVHGGVLQLTYRRRHTFNLDKVYTG